MLRLRTGLHKFITIRSSSVKPSKRIPILIFPRFLKTSCKIGYAVPGNEGPIAEKPKESFDLGKMYEKKPQKPPFVKSLFMGKFDRDILTYPEVLKKDEYDMLTEIIEPLENFMKTEVDSKRIDAEGRIPPETIQGLKDLGMFGLDIPVEYGGLGLTDTAFMRVAEAFAIDSSIAVTLHMHQAVCAQGLLLNGTDVQKKKYLPLLASGQWTGALCITDEGCGSDVASVATTAILERDGSGYRLNGTKIWITNGGTADLMIVIARLKNPWQKILTGVEKEEDHVCAFIVEKGFEGVSCGPPRDKAAVRGANTTEVFFDNVFIPKENMLGEKDEGYKVAMDILGSGRITVGSGCASILRHLMKSAVEHTVTRKQFGQTLSEFGLIKEKLARVAMDIYAMEAMAYLTAGLSDAYFEQDVSVETAILKVFCSERLTVNISNLSQVVGTLGFSKDYPYERYLRDSRIFELIEGTNNIHKLFIGLVGLQYTGIHLNEVVKKIRNPLMHPEFTAKRVMRQFRLSMKEMKLDLDLHEFLHPSLREAAESLEKSTKKFSAAVETFLGREGKNVSLPEHQCNLKRVADIAVDLYAMTAVLGRASRAYCIGIHNCDHEMLIAKLFALEASGRVDSKVEALLESFNEIDDAISTIADSLFEKKGYAALHPLTRTFW